MSKVKNKPNKSSKRWLQEHFSDPYVKGAKKEGYRSRAIYKLMEINKRDHLFKPGMIVIDLGAAPGGWSQFVSKMVKPKGRVIALDLLEMEAIENVEFLQMDFTDETVVDDLVNHLAQEKADWVLSDMSPNISGNASVDIPQSHYLAELALAFALKVLHRDGGLLVKVFQGQGFEQLLIKIQRFFRKTAIRKPKASRGRSRETYISARNKIAG